MKIVGSAGNQRERRDVQREALRRQGSNRGNPISGRSQERTILVESAEIIWESFFEDLIFKEIKECILGVIFG